MTPEELEFWKAAFLAYMRSNRACSDQAAMYAANQADRAVKELHRRLLEVQR